MSRMIIRRAAIGPDSPPLAPGTPVRTGFPGGPLQDGVVVDLNDEWVTVELSGPEERMSP